MYDMMMFFPALNMHVLVHLVVMLAWKKNSSYCYLTIYSEVVKDDATYMRKKILLSLLPYTYVLHECRRESVLLIWKVPGYPN